MKQGYRLAIYIVVLAATCGTTLPIASAQTQRSGNDSARIVQQLQQVTAEKTKLQADNEAVKKELEALKAKYEQASGEQSKLAQRARQLELADAKGKESGKADSEALEKSRAQLQELIGKYRELATTLKSTETDRDQLKSQVAAREREYSTCVDRNAGLYSLNDEVLTKLENQGVWSVLKSKEVFTQLSRTRLENLSDGYRERADELRLKSKDNNTAANQRP